MCQHMYADTRYNENWSHGARQPSAGRRDQRRRPPNSPVAACSRVGRPSTAP